MQLQMEDKFYVIVLMCRMCVCFTHVLYIFSFDPHTNLVNRAGLSSKTCDTCSSFSLNRK